MSYSINNIMAGDTITLAGMGGGSGTPVYATTTNTGSTSSGLYWGVGSGSSGQVLTTNGTGASTWATITANPDLQGNTLSVKGNAEFDGDIKIKGKSLNDSLERIEERLGILRPNEELEEKWEELRNLRKAYMDLEAEIKEKEQIWSILKK